MILKWNEIYSYWWKMRPIKKEYLNCKNSINKYFKKRNLWILLLIGLIAMITAGCIEDKKNNESTGSAIPTETIIVPKITESNISSSSSGLMVQYNLDELISMSDSIITGDVTDILKSKWNTADGNKPANGNQSHIIYTDVIIKVGEYLKNPMGLNIITVRVLGGTAGQDSLELEDQPTYSLNMKALIFLKKDEDPRTKDIGGQHFVTAGNIQGNIPILQNNDIIVGGEKTSLDDIRKRITERGAQNTTVKLN